MSRDQRSSRGRRDQRSDAADGLRDTVVFINRVTKVVKGGKNLSFSALVVVGDEKGNVGYGSGKAKEVPHAIRKGIEIAKKNMIRVPIINNTTPHKVVGVFGAGRVLLKPAAEGTGKAPLLHVGQPRRSDDVRPRLVVVPFPVHPGVNLRRRAKHHDFR